MNKQFFITILLTVLMSMTGAKAFAHDIEVANSDGVTIYYVWTNNNTELAVSYRGSNYSSYSQEYSGNVVIPSSVVYNGNTYSVTSIGGWVFRDCSGLTSVTIPNSVTSIGGLAFSGCSGLTSVTIPNSVTSIGSSAFYGCSGLTSVTIPNSVTSIGGYAFYGCSGLTSVTIPNSVTSIGDGAFSYCSGLTSVTIPNSVTSIGSEAFRGCSGLTSVTIGNSVTSIGQYAFYNCSGLTSVTIPNSVTSIGGDAFYGCSGLATIVSEIKTPFAIGSIGSTSLTLVVPAGTKAAYQSTAGWNSFTKTVEVGEGGVVGCKFEINGICYTIGKNNTASLTSANKAISGTIVIPSQVELNGKKYDVTSIGGYAFYGCSGLTSVTIPNSVTSIGSEAFYGCSSLTSVIIGSGVTSIGSSAFSNTNLKKTIWLTNTPPSGYSYAAGAVNYVSNDQFSLNNQLKYQFLSSYFDVNGIRYVPVSPSERTCDAIDCVYNESAANTKIGPSVTFKGVTMTVKNIQPYIGYGNKYIETLDVDNEGVISEHAFNGCLNMKRAKLGTKVSALGQYAFSGCSSLEAIDIPEIIEVLNEYTFSGCSSLAEIVIKPKMTIIKDYVFQSCTSLKKVILADSDNELKLGANYNFGTPLFSDCPLDSVYIGRNIDYNTTKQYGYSPFYRNLSLRAVKITDKETEISENEFYGCTNLQRVVIGDGVTTIGNWAFSGCQSLKYFAFGSQVATIGQEAFSDCAAVIEISSKAKTAPECGAQALDDINKWDCKLYVPDGCMAAYEAAAQWKDFFFKEEGEGTAGQGAGAHSDDNKKCETPTITVDGGTIKFDCKTSGVMFHYNISSADAKSDVANSSIEVKNNYTVSVYASKEGYTDSEVAKKSFQVAGAGKKGDVNGDNKVDVADHVELSKIILEQGQ